MHELERQRQRLGKFAKACLGGRPIGNDLCLQIRRTDKIHDEEAVVAIDFNLMEPQKAGMLERLAYPELVPKHSFFSEILVSCFYQQLHHQLHRRSVLTDLPDLRATPRGNAVSQLKVADAHLSLSHGLHFPVDGNRLKSESCRRPHNLSAD